MDTNYTTKSPGGDLRGHARPPPRPATPQIEPAHLLVELLSQPDASPPDSWLRSAPTRRPARLSAPPRAASSPSCPPPRAPP